MMFLWSTSELAVSKAIRLGLGEDCSHFSIVFDEHEDGYGLMLHSSLMGVELLWFNKFRESHKIIHALRPRPDFALNQEESVFRAIVTKFYGKSYDYKALAYWAWRGFLKRCFGKPIPSVNRWGDRDQFLCTGIAKALESSTLKDLGLADIPDFEMISPHALYEIMRKSTALAEVPWITCPKSSPAALQPSPQGQ